MADSGSVQAVYLISGPKGTGKSTVARLLADRFQSGVHVEGDFFRRSVVTGTIPENATTGLPLPHRLAASATDAYFAAGFSVVVEDVVAGSLLGPFRTAIRSRPCHVVVLLPSLSKLVARAADIAALEQQYEDFAHEAARVGIWLDTTEQSPEETVDAILRKTSAGPSPLVVTDHDGDWAAQFAELAGVIVDAVSDLGATVEHVGSTSVAGLAAKPIIDIDVVVPSQREVPQAIERLRGLGYIYQGDKGIPGREAFLWPSGARRHHLYVVVAGSKPHRDHIDLRDYLRQHPDAADNYGQLKRALAAERSDVLGYQAGKADFIESTLAAARGVEAQNGGPSS